MRREVARGDREAFLEGGGTEHRQSLLEHDSDHTSVGLHANDTVLELVTLHLREGGERGGL